jgi:zinc transporter ZupT
VETRARKLLSPLIEVEEEEQLSEAIDEQIHQLHYKLDHTRRLLEGSESGSKHTPVTADKAHLVERVAEIKTSVLHLQEHFGATAFDTRTVLEMHNHMDELEGLLTHFHSEVQSGMTYWRRRGGGAQPPKGSRLPLSLLAAVYVDSFIDGFLIGISCVFSQHAGLVLAAANVLEMGFVGASFANTISRCTGASRQMRSVVIYLAPPILLAGAAIGAALGNVSKETPAIFTGFVAFGTVALLFLVVNELLIEAREATKDIDVTWINAVRSRVLRNARPTDPSLPALPQIFFFGIYLVLIFNRYLPGGE